MLLSIKCITGSSTKVYSLPPVSFVELPVMHLIDNSISRRYLFDFYSARLHSTVSSPVVLNYLSYLPLIFFHELPSGHLMASAFSLYTPRRSEGPPLGEKSTNITPGASSFALSTNCFEPSKLSDPMMVTKSSFTVIF